MYPLYLKRKEVNAMTEYGKPEVVVLGDAVRLIQGSKVGKLDAQDPSNEIASDCISED
jgi:hypothetical protein